LSITVSDSEWVIKRAECSGSKVFELLKAEVQKDVETRQTLQKQTDPQGPGFSFVASGDTFAAILTTRRGHDTVRFSLAGDTISVSLNDRDPFLKATLTLSSDQICRLKTREAVPVELDRWQFRCKALEELFFLR